MEFINRHVVNCGVLVQQFDADYFECIPITLYKQVSKLEVFDKRPPFILYIERMVIGRLNRLTAHMDLVNLICLMIKCGSNFFISYLTRGFILRENHISDFNVFNIFLPFVC
ncbi:hypothetical protein D3C76_1272680 [compost metagenome]